MKISKDKRDKLILLSLGIVGLLGLLYTFILGGLQEQLATLKRSMLAAQDKLETAERLVRSQETIEADLKAVQTVLNGRQETMAPDGQYYYWFFKVMREFREQANINPAFLSDISQPEFVAAGLVPEFPYKAASFGLRLNGRYHEIGQFIANLENAFPYFRVEGIRIMPSSLNAGQAFQSPAQKSGTLNVELRVVTLIREETT